MQRIADRLDSTVYRDPAAYTSHPCVTRLACGDLLVAFNETLPHRPPLHPPDDPRSMTLIARSADDGQTWQEPRSAPGYHMTGVECPSIAQPASGAVLLFQWRFAWYPLETARKRAQRSNQAEAFVIPSRRHSSWEAMPAAADDDWDRAELPWARTDGGLHCSISTDDGRTWDETIVVSTAPFARGYSPRPPARLDDGNLLLALASHDARGIVYCIRSSDEGRHWFPPVVVSDYPPLAEPTALALAGHRVVIVTRDDASGFLHLHRSSDDGAHWAPPQPLPVWGYPAHLLLLRDGRLLMVYGVRRPPFGIGISVSCDLGETWDRELVVRDDLPNRNLGYPTAVQLPDGRLFVTYYGEDAEGVTHIMASRFRVP